MCASCGLSWRARAISVKHCELVGVVLLILCVALMARRVGQQVGTEERLTDYLTDA